MTSWPNTETKFVSFFYLAGVQLILAGAWTFAIAWSQSFRTTTVLAVIVMIVGLASMFVPTFLKRQSTNISSVLGGRFGQLGVLAIPVLLSAFLFIRTPDIDALKILGPVLACIWLIGIEVLFFFQTQTPSEWNIEQTTSN